MKDEDKSVTVLPAPELGAAEEARLQLKAASAVFHFRAAEAHANGMSFEGESVRLEQLATILSDELAIEFRDQLLDGGLLVLGDEPVTSAKTNAKGGEA